MLENLTIKSKNIEKIQKICKKAFLFAFHKCIIALSYLKYIRRSI